MLRLVVVSCLLFVVALAGCSSGGGLATPEADARTSSSIAQPVPPRPVARTDTLHLLAPPHMVGTLPESGEEVRTYVPTDVDNVNGPVEVPAWMVPRPELGELEVTLSLVIEVQGTVTNPPRPAIGLAPLSNCFWAVHFFVQHADGSRTGLTNFCRGADPVLAPGIRTLEEAFLMAPEVVFSLGDRFGFSLDTRGVYAPDSGVFLLSGTAAHDSTLTITGLQLPIDTTTLLSQ